MFKNTHDTLLLLQIPTPPFLNVFQKALFLVDNCGRALCAGTDALIIMLSSVRTLILCVVQCWITQFVTDIALSAAFEEI